MIVAKRFDVEATGRGLDMQQLEQIVTGVELDRLESLRDAGATAN